MSSFVPSRHVNPGTDESVTNDGFYPGLVLADFKARMDLNGSDDAARLVNVLTGAMIEINHSLKNWRETLPVATLEEVPCVHYGEVSEKVWLYQDAVFNRARAVLLETRRDYDTTKSGHDKSDVMELPVEDYFRASNEALSRLMDKPRSRIELI